MKKTIIIFSIIGVVLCTIALANNAKLGLYIDKTGAHILEQPQEDFTNFEGEITDLSINSHNAKVEVIEGNEFSVRTKYVYKSPEITFEEGKMNINFPENNIINFGFTFAEEKITVTLPTVTLNSLNITNNNGNITVTNEMFVNFLNIQNQNGKIVVENIGTMNSTIKNENGSIYLIFEAENANITNSNGNITAESIIKGKYDFKNDNGSVKISALNLYDFYKQLNTTNGSVKINDENVKNTVQGNPNAEKQIIVKNGNGSIKLYDFIPVN